MLMMLIIQISSLFVQVREEKRVPYGPCKCPSWVNVSGKD